MISVVIGISILGAINALSGDIYAHDPSFIRSGDCWYVFSTGYTHGAHQNPGYHNGAPQIRRECNGKPFELIGSVFDKIPDWFQTTLHKTISETWAPDINYFNNQWYVYYSGWTYNDAAIGVATASNIEGPYTDLGQVVHTIYRNTSDYVAIDPEIAWTYTNGKRDQPWLVFGSFSDGIKAHRIDPKTGKLSSEDTHLYSLSKIGEASSTAYHNGYYYLFVSDGNCCRGVNSSYHVVVGRAKNITGPYLDRNGVDMVKGGGTLILSTHGDVHGPGGEDVYLDGDTHRMVYHYYDGAHNGRATIDIVDLVWSADDWPSVGPKSKLH